MEEDQVAGPLPLVLEGASTVPDEFVAYANSVTRQREQKRRRLRMVATGGVAAAIALVFALIVVGGGGPGSTNAAAQVIRGARTTLAEHTADLTISCSINDNGQSVPISGTGYADLSANLETMTLSFASNGSTLQETVLQNGPAIYLQLIENDQNAISQVVPGKTWVQLPSEQTSTTELGDGSSNILAQLQLLAAQGNTVVTLGPSTVNGESVTGYQVTVTRKAMAAELKRAEAKGGVEASTIKSALKIFSLSPPVLDVWIGSNNLVQSEKVVISASASRATVGGDVDVAFSNYGSQVSVAIPAANQVAAYGAFLSAAKAAG